MSYLVYRNILRNESFPYYYYYYVIYAFKYTDAFLVIKGKPSEPFKSTNNDSTYPG